jgi:hypothetical protein
LGVDLSGKSNAGKSYVIFGKKDRIAIDLSAHKIYLRLIYRLGWLDKHQQSNHPSHPR